MIAALSTALKPLGMFIRGGFHITGEDHVPGDGQTMLLVGNAGSAIFDALQKAHPDGPHPLDDWTKDKLTQLAVTFEADVLFPFGGAPWHPFQQWAKRADTTYPSPIQMLIHPEYGLWHAYRGALVFDEKLELPVSISARNPCDGCIKPCVDACPVQAFSDAGYDVDGCAAYVKSDAGINCRQNGCLARRACPVGINFKYGSGHANFHMEAFIKAR